MNIRNENGFSLIQVVIASGLMGVVAMFTLKMQSNQLMNQNKIVMDSEVNTFMQKLNGFFQRSDYCEKNLKGKSVISFEPFEIRKFLAPNGKVIFEKGQLYGNRTFELESISDTDFFYDTDEKDTGNLTLTVTLKKHKKSFGSKYIKKKIDLMVYLDQGIIKACSSNSLGLGGSGTNIKMEDVHNVVNGKTDENTSAETKQKYKEIQKTIDANPALLELQKSIKMLEESSERINELGSDY